MATAHQPLAGVEQAAKSIIALINGRPRSPTEGEIICAIEQAVASPAPAMTSASDLGQQIRSVVRVIAADDARLGQLPEDSHLYQACQYRIDAAFTRLDDLTSRLPMVPHTFAELLTIGELAFYWASKDADGTLCELDPENPCRDAYWAARLILAVVTMGGRQHA